MSTGSSARKICTPVGIIVHPRARERPRGGAHRRSRAPRRSARRRRRWPRRAHPPAPDHLLQAGRRARARRRSSSAGTPASASVEEAPHALAWRAPSSTTEASPLRRRARARKRPPRARSPPTPKPARPTAPRSSSSACPSPCDSRAICERTRLTKGVPLRLSDEALADVPDAERVRFVLAQVEG